MPYVNKRVSGELLEEPTREAATVGELTFMLQQQIDRYLRRKGTVQFHDLAECIGALEAAKMDFTARVLIPYEQGRLIAHGDVWSEGILRRAYER